MTKFEWCMAKKDLYETKARETNDVDLRQFYANASKGFELRALNMSVEEAFQPV